MANVLHRIDGRYLLSVNTPNFDSADWAINPVGADILLASGVPAKYWKLSGVHPSESVAEMSAAEKTAIDDAPVGLADEKKFRYAELDGKTLSLIQNGNGFTYAGKQFSLSDNAQRYIAGLKQAVDAALLVPPIDVTTLDDDAHTLADAAEITAFYGGALAAVKSHLDSGRALKKQVFDATTRAAVDLVVDTR